MASICIAALLLLQGDSADAVSLYRAHRYAEAAQSFLRKTTAGGERAEDVLMLAQSLYYSGQYRSAIPWLQKALLAGNKISEVGYMLGMAFLFTQKPDDSVGAFARVFGVRPDSAAAHLIAAEMMVRQELLDFAIDQVTTAVKLEPAIPQAHYLMGVIALARGEVDDGIQELQSEVSLNPDFAMAYYRLGDAWSRKQDWDKAVTDLQRSIWLNQAYNGPYILLGKAYLQKGDLADAEGILRRAVQMDPRNRSANYLLGQTLVKLGRAEEGRKLLERAAGLQPDSAQ